MKVLIVEDDEAIAAMLRYNLKSEGFVVEHTEDGGEAIAIAVRSIAQKYFMGAGRRGYL